MQVQGIFLLNNSKKTGGARAPCAPPVVTSLMSKYESERFDIENHLKIVKIRTKLTKY